MSTNKSFKYLERKDILDIAVVYKILNKTKLNDLIILLYYKIEKPEYQLTVFPISVYKTLIQDEDFETFLYLSSYEKKFPKSSLFELWKYSINESPMFWIYFAKNYKKKLRKYINEIIDHLIKSIDHNESKLIRLLQIKIFVL